MTASILLIVLGSVLWFFVGWNITSFIKRKIDDKNSWIEETSENVMVLSKYKKKGLDSNFYEKTDKVTVFLYKGKMVTSKEYSHFSIAEPGCEQAVTVKKWYKNGLLWKFEIK